MRLLSDVLRLTGRASSSNSFRLTGTEINRHSYPLRENFVLETQMQKKGVPRILREKLSVTRATRIYGTAFPACSPKKEKIRG